MLRIYGDYDLDTSNDCVIPSLLSKFSSQQSGTLVIFNDSFCLPRRPEEYTIVSPLMHRTFGQPNVLIPPHPFEMSHNLLFLQPHNRHDAAASRKATLTRGQQAMNGL